LDKKKALIREHAGRARPEDDRFDSVTGALEEMERLAGWLGYVLENEYSQRERNALIGAARQFAKIAQPIANKYLD